MGQNDGIHTVVSATILGIFVLGGALLVGRSMDRATLQLSWLQTTAGEIKSLIETADARPARARNGQARRGPDPERVYQVDAERAPARGMKNAAVTLVAFSDFQCPYCARVAPALDQIEEEYGDKVRIAFKHLPLSIHPKAPAAHAAAQAAHLQGKFWEMHDKIFANQRLMSEDKYLEWALELGLDLERFKRDVTSSEVKERIELDQAEASRLGIRGTPGFFINGRYLPGAKPYLEFKRLIDEELDS